MSVIVMCILKVKNLLEVKNDTYISSTSHITVFTISKEEIVSILRQEKVTCLMTFHTLIFRHKYLRKLSFLFDG